MRLSLSLSLSLSSHESLKNVIQLDTNGGHNIKMSVVSIWFSKLISLSGRKLHLWPEGNRQWRERKRERERRFGHKVDFE